MSRDLDQLKQDWENHPNLRKYACPDLKTLEKMLTDSHYYLMSGESLNHGYLYQKQVEVNNKLKTRIKELEDERSKQ